MRTSRLLIAVSAAASSTYLLTRPLTAGDWPVIFAVLSTFLLAVLGFRVDRLLGGCAGLLLAGRFSFRRRDGSGRSDRRVALSSRPEFVSARPSGLYRDVPQVPASLSGGNLVRMRLVGRGDGSHCARVGAGNLTAFARSHAGTCGGLFAGVVGDGQSARCWPISGLPWRPSEPCCSFPPMRCSRSASSADPFPGNEQLVWITYYAAQFLILWGVERHQSVEKRTI